MGLGLTGLVWTRPNRLSGNRTVAKSYYVGRGKSYKAIRKPEYALEEMITTWSNIHKFHIRMPFNFFI